MTTEEKYQLTDQVLRELSITAKAYYTKDTVLTIGVVRKLIELTIERIDNQNLNLSPDEETI
jgi:hypothetical protein